MKFSKDPRLCQFLNGTRLFCLLTGDRMKSEGLQILLSPSMAKGFELAREHHRNLPAHVREYLQQARGISPEIIDLHLLGWNGTRITIPIFDRAGQFSF